MAVFYITNYNREGKTPQYYPAVAEVNGRYYKTEVRHIPGGEDREWSYFVQNQDLNYYRMGSAGRRALDADWNYIVNPGQIRSVSVPEFRQKLRFASEDERGMLPL